MIRRPTPLPSRPALKPFSVLAAHYPQIDAAAFEAYVEFRAANGRISLALDAYFARHGLSFNRFLVLNQLLRSEHESLTPAEIAAACGVTRPTATALIDQLEAAGFVAREDDATDRRCVHVRVTPLGHRRMESVLPGHFHSLRRMLEGLTHAELRTLAALATRVADGASAIAPP